MNLKEAIEFLEKVKKQQVHDIKNYSFLVMDKYYPSKGVTLFTKEGLIEWAKELKRKEAENDKSNGNCQDDK